jgi:hypothetical protein
MSASLSAMQTMCVWGLADSFLLRPLQGFQPSITLLLFDERGLPQRLLVGRVQELFILANPGRRLHGPQWRPLRGEGVEQIQQNTTGRTAIERTDADDPFFGTRRSAAVVSWTIKTTG